MLLSAGCDPRPASAPAPTSVVAVAPDASPAPAPVLPAVEDSAAPTLRGITHEELLRRADAEGQDAAESPFTVEGRALPTDTTFADETPTDVARMRFELRFPDERADRPSVERVLRVDDQGERIHALFYGTGFVLAPGLRVGGRGSMSGWALIGADQRAHRAMAPDALRQWFAGSELGSSTSVAVRRSADGVVAVRGPLSVTLQSDPAGPARPLSCRLFVSLLLGGDTSALRLGCDGARSPTRVTLRARGEPVLAFVRVESATVQMPRDAMAVPPSAALATELPVPSRGLEGGFFTPNELLGLEPVRPASAPAPRRPAGWAPTSSAIEVHNPSEHELVLFIDDAAVGWVGPGRSATFSGVASGRHALRARSVDGQHRAEPATVTAPGRWEITVPRARGR